MKEHILIFKVFDLLEGELKKEKIGLYNFLKTKMQNMKLSGLQEMVGAYIYD